MNSDVCSMAFRHGRTRRGDLVERHPVKVDQSDPNILSAFGGFLMRLATDEKTEDLGLEDDGKDKAARVMGKKGGAARAKSLYG
jgi:hypothetical protein